MITCQSFTGNKLGTNFRINIHADISHDDELRTAREAFTELSNMDFKGGKSSCLSIRSSLLTNPIQDLR